MPTTPKTALEPTPVGAFSLPAVYPVGSGDTINTNRPLLCCMVNRDRRYFPCYEEVLRVFCRVLKEARNLVVRASAFLYAEGLEMADIIHIIQDKYRLSPLTPDVPRRGVQGQKGAVERARVPVP